MLKRDGKARPYTKALDGGWGWMIVFHFFLVRISLSYCLKEGTLEKGSKQPNKITYEILHILMDRGQSKARNRQQLLKSVAHNEPMRKLKTSTLSESSSIPTLSPPLPCHPSKTENVPVTSTALPWLHDNQALGTIMALPVPEAAPGSTEERFGWLLLSSARRSHCWQLPPSPKGIGIFPLFFLLLTSQPTPTSHNRH